MHGNAVSTALNLSTSVVTTAGLGNVSNTTERSRKAACTWPKSTAATALRRRPAVVATCDTRRGNSQVERRAHSHADEQLTACCCGRLESVVDTVATPLPILATLPDVRRDATAASVPTRPAAVSLRRVGSKSSRDRRSARSLPTSSSRAGSVFFPSMVPWSNFCSVDGDAAAVVTASTWH